MSIIGSIAGFVGGKVDEFLMRVVDVFLAVPELILALAIAALLGPSFTNIIIAITVLGWCRYARIIRAQIIHTKENEYVDAARVIGDSKLRIYTKDILPNSITPVVVAATLQMGAVVIFAATLSFIGLAEAGLAEWGNLVSRGSVRNHFRALVGRHVRRPDGLPLVLGLQPVRRRPARRPRPAK